MVAALVLGLTVCIGVWYRQAARVPTPPSAAAATDEGSGSDGPHDGQGGDGGTSDRVSEELADVLDGTLPSALVTDGAQTVTWTEDGGVEQVATRLLVTYRDGEPCVLCQAGYLDLLGRVWSCVVQGDGWIDVCVVKEGDGESAVTVMRLDGDKAASVLVGEDE